MEVKQGAVIVGYQGIGKSTLAKIYDRIIDLESSNFFVGEEPDLRRPNLWEEIYCNIARDLCDKGYIVFVSSHNVVRRELRAKPAMYEGIKSQYLIFPRLSLENAWNSKLEDRYKNDSSDKNFKAYLNSRNWYNANIHDLMNQEGFWHKTITELDYDLEQILEELGLLG